MILLGIEKWLGVGFFRDKAKCVYKKNSPANKYRTILTLLDSVYSLKSCPPAELSSALTECLNIVFIINFKNRGILNQTYKLVKSGQPFS